MNNLHTSIQALLGHYNELLRQVKELRIRVNGAGGSTDDANDLATALVSQHTQAVSQALAGEPEPVGTLAADVPSAPAALPFPFGAPAAPVESFAPPVPVNPVPEPAAETQEPSAEAPAV